MPYKGRRHGREPQRSHEPGVLGVRSYSGSCSVSCSPSNPQSPTRSRSAGRSYVWRKLSSCSWAISRRGTGVDKGRVAERAGGVSPSTRGGDTGLHGVRVNQPGLAESNVVGLVGRDVIFAMARMRRWCERRWRRWRRWSGARHGWDGPQEWQAPC